VPAHNRRPPLRVIKSDYVEESLFMLRRLPPESVLTYLLVITHEAQQAGTLTPVWSAHVSRWVIHLIKEIDKAA
jgi:radical SAM superfamily enzyme